MTKLMLPTILAIFFWPVWTPPVLSLPAELCEEIKESLEMGVDEGTITNEEAQWIYEGCGRWVERGGLLQD